IGWVSTWNTRCGIATYSQYLTVAIPPERLRVFATRRPELVAPDGGYVARCWNESVDHEDIDELFGQIVETAVEAVVIQYNFGFFPVRSLGRLVRRLKER